MNIFDIVGPIMVGPSSSHTAGAVRIGYITRRLLGEPVIRAEIGLCGSFLATGKGHGTDKALVAGLLGLAVDDMRIPESFEMAKKQGLSFRFTAEEIPEAHPNTAHLKVEGASGQKLDIVAASVGGGRMKVCSIDGITAEFYGECPTLVVQDRDEPGQVADMTTMLAQANINIATM